MGNISTPYGISYNIHGHNDCNGSERTPHVHILCQGCRISVSLLDASIIVGAGQLDRNKEKEVLRWVSNNLYALKAEWESKSDPLR